jgi:DNA-binding transcriptional regulator GbsR (MarR family)
MRDATELRENEVGAGARAPGEPTPPVPSWSKTLALEERSEYSELKMSPLKPDTLREFVEAWGAMGSLWGINRSVARVHALLMASEGPVSLDEIAERLQISKGNASMSLRELRTFGVVRQVEAPGDRRDFYVTEPDVWTMFFRILKERKRREFDPALDAIRGLVERAGADGEVKERLEQMADLLSTADGVMARFLKDPQSSRAALAFMSGVPVGGRRKSKKKG